MGDKSAIEWTDATWNPATGCTRVSPGCDHCYIERTPPFRMQGRAFDKPGEGGTTGVELHYDRLDQPLRWKRPRRIFVNSLSDLYHDQISNAFIAAVFAIMAMSQEHTFQILTKRPRRMRVLLNDGFFARDFLAFGSRSLNRFALDQMVNRLEEAFGQYGSPIPFPLPNVWLGVSVEDQKRVDLRIPLLLETAAAVRFLSCEPLLGPINLSHWLSEGGIDWVIAGGESGPNARPMHPAWVRSIRDECQSAGVPFFFKQWGEFVPGQSTDIRKRDRWIVRPDGSRAYLSTSTGHTLNEFRKGAVLMYRAGKKAAGRRVDGRTWDEYPISVGAAR